ncbi:MAG: N-acetylneuraminate synthase family protein [Limnohabitans sp.]|nr:N-acetylneuraminate synthase family protein [Limnohabitans sp.]
MNPCWNDDGRRGEPFFLGGREIGAGRTPFVIAEIGVNHDGSFQRARELVHAARDAGADAAKFQMFDAAMLMSRDAVLAAYQKLQGASDPRDMLTALALKPDELGRLADECVDCGLVPIVTVFSLPLFAFAREQSWHAFKTASPDLVNLPLLQTVASFGKPLIVSTGAATREEVAQAARWLADVRQLAFLQCTSSYPARDDVAAIGAMHEIRAITGRTVGYSDHTASMDTGGLAVAAGAAILEKHLTYDRGACGPDHAASLDPMQFAGYVALAHRAARMVGGFTKELQTVERDVRTVSRQSLVAVCDLPEGHLVTPADLCVKRPGTGICASRLDDIVGRRLARAVEADRVLVEADILWPVAAESGL